MPEPRFYSDLHPAPIQTVDIGNKPVPIMDWEYDKDTLEVKPVFTGQYKDPDADIQAARQETLTEMMARMPGKSPLEKVEYAVNTGLIVPPEISKDGEEPKTYDLRNVPHDIAEAQALIRQAAESYNKLPDEIKAYKGATVEEKIKNYIADSVAAQVAAKDKTEETEK